MNRFTKNGSAPFLKTAHGLYGIVTEMHLRKLHCKPNLSNENTGSIEINNWLHKYSKTAGNISLK